MMRLPMMNNTKEKKGRKKCFPVFLPLVTTCMVLASSMTGTIVTADNGQSAEAIMIEKPSGWKQGSTTVHITVEPSVLGEGKTIARVEAKVGDGEWKDITSEMTVSITSNTTVYARVVDSAGDIYEQNRSIRCYDTEKPTLSASLTDGVLTIQGQDTFSGISGITVNGTNYSELKDGLLKIQLTQKDLTTKKIEISATDGAGNASDIYSLQNPYYEWAVKQAIAQQADSSENLSTTTETGEENQVIAPLPQNATPSEPTESRGTVEDRTVTGIEQELAQKNETVDTISSTTTAGGKEFYTISTKSGKVFYLIIDNDSATDNVYFLTEVDNDDLMNFTLSDTVTLPSVDTVYATVEETPAPTPTPEPVTETETQEEEPEVQMPEKNMNLASYILMGLLFAAIFAGAYYFKIYKPKQESFDEDEYEEEYEEESGSHDEEDEHREMLEDEEE